MVVVDGGRAEGLGAEPGEEVPLLVDGRVGHVRVPDDQPVPPAGPGLLDADADKARRAALLPGGQRRSVVVVVAVLPGVVAVEPVAERAAQRGRHRLVDPVGQIGHDLEGLLAQAHHSVSKRR